jgi:hypothetical protein
VIELKITNNAEARQTLRVPRFWECFCDNPRLGFGGWDKELRAYPGGNRGPLSGSQAQSWTNVELAPGESYARSWNWVDVSQDDPPKEFTFRMGLVINGSMGDERVWSSPITFKYTKPSDKAADTK